uniref:Immunoglobulin V-set domain-containing protein n=1 Tax=Gadus morhua TaxID=8049 RepID=A0A8C5BLD1_GADMO
MSFNCAAALCTADPTAVHLSHHTVREVKGNVGGNISFQCSGEWSSAGSQSYFCKSSKCSSEDAKTGGSDKYSIEDKGNTFITTIMNLQPEDTGTYWCGIERTGIDTFVDEVIKHLSSSPYSAWPAQRRWPANETRPCERHMCVCEYKHCNASISCRFFDVPCISTTRLLWGLSEPWLRRNWGKGTLALTR